MKQAIWTGALMAVLAGFCCVGLAQTFGTSSESDLGSVAGRPMTFADLQRMKRVSDPQISPSGKWVMFSVVDVDLEKNSKVSHLWVVPMAASQGAGDGSSGAERQVTFWKDGESGGRFSPDGKQVLFVATDGSNGLSQVFLAPWDEAAGKLGTPKRLNNVRTEAGGAIWSPDSQRVLFVSRVYPGCSDERVWLDEDNCDRRQDGVAAANPVKAQIFDHLLYRHWDHYVGLKRSHVLVVSAMDGNVVRDLTPRREIGDAEAPTFSLGGPMGYAWAPDSKEIAFVTNLDLVPAVSTNNDVFTLRLDDPSATPVKVSTSLGSDDGPAYSPDGKYLAFRSQARAGYESDRFGLMVFDRQEKSTAEVAPKFDGWFDEFSWLTDSRHLAFTSSKEGEEPYGVVAIEEHTPARRTLSMRTDLKGEFSDLRVLPDLTIVASLMKVDAPTEIVKITPQNYDKDGKSAGGQIVQLSHMNAGVLNKLDLPTMESYWFPGAEGAKVQGFGIRPPNFDATKKYPLKFLIHGGPQGAWGDAWSY